LEREPTLDEIKLALDERFPFEGIDEIVFCGYGEPMERAIVVVEVSRYVKALMPGLPVRVNTNGLVYLMCPGFDVSSLAIVDTVSVSLNADDTAEYLRVARPRFGEPSFESLLNFAWEARVYTNVVFTVVEGTLSPVRLENCKRIAQEMGVAFRRRPME